MLVNSYILTAFYNSLDGKILDLEYHIISQWSRILPTKHSRQNGYYLFVPYKIFLRTVSMFLLCLKIIIFTLTVYL